MSLEALLAEAEEKAWDSLARYKFQMFGYWASIWVHINRAGGFHRHSPFGGVVRLARLERREQPRRWQAEIGLAVGMEEVKDAEMEKLGPGPR